MQKLEPYITVGGDVYRGQVVGFHAGGGPVARLEVCLDCTGNRPRIVDRRDWTFLGRGFSPTDLGMIVEDRPGQQSGEQPAGEL